MKKYLNFAIGFLFMQTSSFAFDLAGDWTGQGQWLQASDGQERVERQCSGVGINISEVDGLLNVQLNWHCERAGVEYSWPTLELRGRAVYKNNWPVGTWSNNELIIESNIRGASAQRKYMTLTDKNTLQYEAITFVGKTKLIERALLKKSRP